MLSDLLYVSRNLLTLPEEAAQLMEIQLASLSRNSLLDITGFLVATPGHFAQYLEGDRSSLVAVMESIRADPRHRDIRETELPVIKARRFPHWRMGCFFPGNFTSRHVEPLLEEYHRDLSPGTALDLIKEMQVTWSGVTLPLHSLDPR